MLRRLRDYEYLMIIQLTSRNKVKQYRSYMINVFFTVFMFKKIGVLYSVSLYCLVQFM